MTNVTLISLRHVSKSDYIWKNPTDRLTALLLAVARPRQPSQGNTA